MSGDTYLFRRSPSIDRLGRDCPKLTLLATFDTSLESVDRGSLVSVADLRVLPGTSVFKNKHAILNIFPYFLESDRSCLKVNMPF